MIKIKAFVCPLSNSYKEKINIIWLSEPILQKMSFAFLLKISQKE